MKQPTRFIPSAQTMAELQRTYRHRLKKSGGKPISFTCHQEQLMILESYIGYKRVDLINYAISLLPDNLKRK